MMAGFIGKRILQMLATLIALSVATFFLMRLAPGWTRQLMLR